MTVIEGEPLRILDRLMVDQPALAPLRTDLERAYGLEIGRASCRERVYVLV